MLLFVEFVLALSPVIWLVISLCVLKQEAYVASLEALLVGVIVAGLYWHMDGYDVFTAAAEGFLFALWPIVIVIIAAVFTYNVTVHTGAMETIKGMLCGVSADRRVLTLLIAWCFGGFLEGMAGFGTAIAIPASMLLALGVDPIEAILACLIANGMPTMFGSIGIPTTTLASITGIDAIELGTVQALQSFPFVVACPFLIVMLVGHGPRAVKGVLPVTLAAGLSFAIPEVLAAHFIGANLPDVVASVVSLGVTFAVALGMRRREVPTEQALDVPAQEGTLTAGEALRAWSPFILVFVVLLLTSKLFPAIAEPLSSIKTEAVIYSGEGAATLTFTWVNTPGVLIFACGVVGALIQGCGPQEIAQVLGQTVQQMAKTIITMLGVLGVAKIMGYSGMIAAIAAFFVGTLGGAYPLVAPVLGALGTFVTGSGTSSELLFGNVQVEAARAIGVDATWLAAANSLGTGAGKMLAPQSIAIGTAACGLTGADGQILARIARYAFGFLVFMALLVFVGSLMGA